MPAILALLSWSMFAGFSGSGLAYLAKIRLPVYNFQIQQFPTLVRDKASTSSLLPAYFARIGANISLTNDNFVPIDVHAMSIQLYYPTWSNTLPKQQYYRMAHIRDERQEYNDPLWKIQSSSTDVDFHAEWNTDVAKTTTTNKSKGKGKSINDSKNMTQEDAIQYFIQKEKDKQEKLQTRRRRREKDQQQHSMAPSLNASASDATLWKIPARDQFSIQDHVLVDHQMSVMGVPRLLYDLIFVNRGAHIHVPSSGVLHIKALGAPATVGIVCDNIFHVWSLTMEGYTCDLAGLPQVGGWSDPAAYFAKIEQKHYIIV
uniref:Uncharacterized protein n=1 Tax=Craspedostauros australis TaxID=1486917 RepID=A0A7R9ZIZ2_9STRA|mmetsp:Transcript_13745/g.37803  ORF Transcript_13745/g.37803 Transcript_13745/m.37803 type:complete len:316 (+) Transcript_13745:343-1290(+)